MRLITLTGILAGLSVGAVLGVATFTFVYAKGVSYLTDDPRACVNCHVMQPQYDGWQHSSHRHAATCNDCHTPAGLLPKYVNKAQNGFWHSFYFTTGGYPDNLQINARNRRVTEAACRKCHADIVHGIEGIGPTDDPSQRTSCLHCHSTVGHTF